MNGTIIDVNGNVIAKVRGRVEILDARYKFVAAVVSPGDDIVSQTAPAYMLAPDDAPPAAKKSEEDLQGMF